MLIAVLCPLQLRVLLDQFLQTEARELYRNLRIFPIPFALIDSSLAVFRVLHLLSGTEPALARRLLNRQLWPLELLPARCKELRNIVDRVIVPHRGSGLCLDPLRIPTRTLIFVLVGIMHGLGPRSP